jgi:hypothetical protein
MRAPPSNSPSRRAWTNRSPGHGGDASHAVPSSPALPLSRRWSPTAHPATLDVPLCTMAAASSRHGRPSTPVRSHGRARSFPCATDGRRRPRRAS